MRRTALTFCLLASAAFGARILVAMQAPAANYVESKIPAYTLPDPLVLDNGGKVASARDWTSTRRPELLARFATVEYGKTPKATLAVTAKVDEEGPAFGGSAMRRQVTLHFGPPAGGLDMHLLLYVPAKATEPVPAFLVLNFLGNQAVANDAAIRLATSWLPDRDKGVVNHRATDAARGTEASRFPIDLLISHGYALATVYYGDLDPDFDDGFQNGVQPLFYKAGQSRPAEGEWGAIGAWAWGLSRALDYLEKEEVFAAEKVALVGHSRLGKAALWAGAQDDRLDGLAVDPLVQRGAARAGLVRDHDGEAVILRAGPERGLAEP